MIDVTNVNATSLVAIIYVSSTQSLSYGLRLYVTITHWICCGPLNRHFLRLSISRCCRLLNLLMVLVFLQISVSLRMGKVLLICVSLKTASHLVLISIIEAILNIYFLVVSSTVGMVDLLDATSWRCEWMSIDLWIVATNIVGSLGHIKSPIWLTKFFHII